MFDEWAKQLAAEGGYNTGNIYQNAVRSGGPNMGASANSGRQAAAQADNDEIARRNAEQAKAFAEEQAKAAQDPSKVQMKMRPNGQGYDFYDGVGKKIGINEFSLIVGKSPAEILKDSDNPNDQRFVRDYVAIKDLSNAWVNGDKETLASYRAADPKKFKELLSKYKSPGDMMKAFTQFYSDYYGNTAGKNKASGRSFGPQSLQAPDKNTAGILNNTTLQQTLQPGNLKAPGFSGGIKGAIEKTPFLNRFTGQRDSRRRFQDEIDSNPWLRYQSDILNGANTRGWFGGLYR